VGKALMPCAPGNGPLKRSFLHASSHSAGRNFVAPPANPAYDESMAKAKKFDLKAPTANFDDEDEETLAAIDEGIRDVEAGRVEPAEKARELAAF
jgi:hypothetical protein